MKERNRKKRKEDKTVFFMIVTIIYTWKIAGEFAVISPVMGFNHLPFSASFQIKILIKDKAITKIHRNNYKYYQ